MKFLVMWEFAGLGLRPEIVQAVMRMPDYAKKISDQGKLIARYHIVGKHGGAWIYDVASNEELERLLAVAPVYNYVRYDIYPLADMETPADILRPGEEPS
ncbi:MAG TPA: muconolactone Delta-isomerase family protein [Chloroflexota bacterium]|nr:muconolactone Delta-isomerase family protein [Chloroflexota bacterium]